MNWFVIICIAGFVIYILIKDQLDKSTKGDSNKRPKTKIQAKADNSLRPKQGSSQTPITSASGTLYLVTHSTFNAAKIGISNNDTANDRVGEHVSNGWSIEGLWTVPAFRDVEQIEGVVIAWWRNSLKLPPCCTAQQMPQGGFTETVSLQELGVSQILNFVNDLVNRHQGQSAIEVKICELIPGAAMRVSAELVYATKDYRRAYIPGTYKTTVVSHTWHQWVLQDETGELLVEMQEREAVPIYKLKIGSTIQVTGRVERIGETLRMTNPVYTVTNENKITGKSKKQFENLKPRKSTPSVVNRNQRKQSSSFPKQSTRKNHSSAHKKTNFEEKAHGYQSQRENLSESYLIERCSSCGAAVPNGTSHDCK